MKKKIILGVSASISAYKAYELTRLFVKADYSVHVVLTDNSLNLVSPLTFQVLSGNQVFTDEVYWNDREMGHIELKENADLLVVAPATANIIGKFASGIADDMLSTTFLAAGCPVLVAPAMNPNMWKHPAVQRNVSTLKSWGVHFVDPAEGLAVCGDEGAGRLAEIETIFRAAENVIKG